MPRELRAMPAPVGEPLGAHAAANAPATTSPSVVEEDVIIDYLQNNLSAAERESFERRLADDSDARKVVAALAGLSIFSSTLPANAPKSERAGSEGARGEGAAVPSPGEVLVDKYRVVAQLGRGAMGVVLEVEHVLLGERYALKLLRGGSAADKSSVQRLVREARAAMRIDSPHVARVFDLGVLTDGRLFLVMELLTGRDLRSILADEGALPVERAILYLRQAALGVRAAHAAGVVHRDLKPANLFVARTEQGECLKVVDFGLSKAPDVHRRAADDAALTTSGSVIGSPMYMAPEQIRDPKSADARSDVWALGVVLYEMVTGTPPYSARTVAGVLAAIMVDAPRPLDETRIPAGLRRTIGDCLAKDPDQRIQSAEMLLQRLQGQDDDRRDEPRAPRPSRARGWMAAASVLVAAVAALASVSAGARSAAIPARTLALPSEAMSRAASFAVTTAAPAAPISPVPAVPTAPESSVAVPVAAVRPRPAKPPTPAPTASSSADAPLDVVFGKETEQRQ